MIQSHQPRIFAKALVCGLSSVEDGNQSALRGDADEASANVVAFLKKLGISPGQTSVIGVTYDGNNFCRYYELDPRATGPILRGDGQKIICDALVTTRPGRAILLPLGDCCGAILYAPDKKVLMVSHLGRHSTQVDGAIKSVQYLRDTHGCDPERLIVWLSPAAGKDAYPLRARSNRGLHEELVRQFSAAGVFKEHIEVCSIDTTTDAAYFSHSQLLKDSSQPDGRFAIVAMLPEPTNNAL